MSLPPPPHLDRLRHRLEELPGPLVEIHGLPGCGQSELLAACARSGDAFPLALAEVADPESVRATLAREEPALAGARWLIAPGLPPAAMERAASLLRPGQRLLFVAPSPHPEPGSSAGTGFEEGSVAAVLGRSRTSPRELLLTRAEAAELWRGELGAAGAAAVGDVARGEGDPPEALWRATAGWYRPLALAARAVGEGRLAPGLASGGRRGAEEALLALPEVAAFLETEVGRAAPAAAGWPEPPLLAAFRGTAAGSPPAEPAPAPAAGVGTVPAGGFRIELLGRPRVLAGVADRPLEAGEAGSEREVRFPIRRALHVLAYLAAARGHEASRDELVAAFWEGDSEEVVARNFHPTLSHLRRALAAALASGDGEPPSPVVLEGGAYRLASALPWRIDVDELRALAEQGRAAARAGYLGAARSAFAAAWSLYRGPFAEGIDAPWAEPHRDRWRRLHLDLLRDQGDLAARLGRPTEAMDAYRALLVEDPLQERVHVAVMRLYAEQGRRDLARTQYHRLTTLLGEELGVEPLPETVEAYQRLMT